MSPSRAATYLYCIVQRDRPPVLTRTPRGLKGLGGPRLLPGPANLWLVVARAPLPAFGAKAIERGLKSLEWVSACAVAHEAVAGSFLTQGTVLPVKLFTLFDDDQRAQRFAARRRAALERSARRVAGCWEWGLRVTLNPRRLGALARGRNAPARSGAAFLQHKLRQREAPRVALSSALREAGRLYTRLSGEAEAAKRQEVAADGAAKLLLDGAFLVPINSGTDFRRLVAGEARRIEPKGLDVMLTGPWPPYNFA